MACIWDLTVAEKERGKGYDCALLKGMIQAARQAQSKDLMDFGTPNPRDCSLSQLLVSNGFRICGTNDRSFDYHKNPTAVFNGYDL